MSVTDYLNSATQGAANIIGALNGNKSPQQQQKPATTTSSSMEKIFLIVGGGLALILVFVFVLREK